jgi:hypothetical protein
LVTCLNLAVTAAGFPPITLCFTTEDEEAA